MGSAKDWVARFEELENLVGRLVIVVARHVTHVLSNMLPRGAKRLDELLLLFAFKAKRFVDCLGEGFEHFVMPREKRFLLFRVHSCVGSVIAWNWVDS